MVNYFIEIGFVPPMAHLEHGDSIQSSTHDIWAMGTDSPYIWGGLLSSHGYTTSRLIASAIKPDTSPAWIYLRRARRAKHARRLSSITILSAMVRRFSCTLCSILEYSAPRRLLSQCLLLFLLNHIYPSAALAQGTGHSTDRALS